MPRWWLSRYSKTYFFLRDGGALVEHDANLHCTGGWDMHGLVQAQALMMPYGLATRCIQVIYLCFRRIEVSREKCIQLRKDSN